ncbi:MAG: methyltransferase domain-containing protein [Nitrospinales bacterium]
MMFSPPRRNLRAELLDLDEAPFEEVRDSLQDVCRVNRFLSGYRVLLHHIEDFLRQHSSDQPFTILDVATGSADQPIAVVELARRLGIPVKITAIDINNKMLKYAREETRNYPEIELVQCDILALPFQESAFDVVINSLSLHHFTRENAIAILRAIYPMGRRGIIINDLHRSRVAYISILILTRMFTRNRLTRFDAPVSVMNAFTPKEMKELATEAGWPRFKVHCHFPYRIALVAGK